MAFLGRIDVSVNAPNLPLNALMERWRQVRFEPAACRAALEDLIETHDLPREFFDPSAIERGGLAATEALIFGAFGGPRTVRCVIEGRDGRVAAMQGGLDTLEQLGGLVRLILEADNREALLDSVDGLTEEELEIIGGAYGDTAEHGRWPDPMRPGVHRREHASLLIRTPGGCLVTDPQRLERGWTTDGGRYPSETRPARAQVLLTHTHNDHYSLSSILAWTDPETPVVVPHVPRPSLLAEDVAMILRASGQACATPAWHSRFAAGDVQVDILPFYGEQPARTLALPHPDARNWGNCYRFDLGDHSLAILVDSGVDATGSMVQALERSVAERGPIDVVMSCCLEFPEAVNPGLPHYFLMIPFDELRGLWEKPASMTMGTSGIAEACRVAGAKFFLPYAHGFGGLGASPQSNEGGMREAACVQQIRGLLEAQRTPTRVVPWNPGDVMRWDRGEVVID